MKLKCILLLISIYKTSRGGGGGAGGAGEGNCLCSSNHWEHIIAFLANFHPVSKYPVYSPGCPFAVSMHWPIANGNSLQNRMII